MIDLVFRDALVVDGRGGEPFRGDVAVDRGVIVAVGARLDASAARTIAADGLALMPGIVDSHTHFDAQITWDPTLSPSPALGVTTAVIGNCGFTIAPCRPADRELTMRNLTQVEGMSIDALRAGIDWGFESFGEYMAQLRRHGSVANVAAYVGHSSVRTYVMGDDAARREASADEIAQMQAIVRDAMAHGAVGFASSTSPAHNGEGGLPMPSRLASDAEMAALVGAMGEGGRGVYMLTKGAHTKVAFLESLAAATGRPVMVAALLHNSMAPQAVFDDLDAIAAANARGHRLLGQVSCCALTMDFTLASPYPVEGLASWKPALGRSGGELKAVLADRTFRDAVRAELKTATTFRLFNSEWDKVHVVETVRPDLGRHEQRSIAAIAGADGRDPLDTMLDIALADDLKTVFTAQLLNSDEDAVGRMLNHPHSIVSLSDAGAHLTFFNDAGFGLHLLGHWSRDLGAISLADAVRRLTSHPASVLGLRRPRHDRRRSGRGPAPVRSEDDRPRSQAACPRPALGRSAPHHRCHRRARRVGQRSPGRRCARPARRCTAGRRAADRVRRLTPARARAPTRPDSGSGRQRVDQRGERSAIDLRRIGMQAAVAATGDLDPADAGRRRVAKLATERHRHRVVEVAVQHEDRCVDRADLRERVEALAGEPDGDRPERSRRGAGEIDQAREGRFDDRAPRSRRRGAGGSPDRSRPRRRASGRRSRACADRVVAAPARSRPPRRRRRWSVSDGMIGVLSPQPR